MNLVLKSGVSTQNLIKKFKNRQQENQIQQALVYLKLKQFNCPTKHALIFAKKKQKAIDGTVQKDGPANYRKLVPIKPQGLVVNGWLRGQKLKYQSTTCYNNFTKFTTSQVVTGINDHNRVSRISQQNQRILRSKSLIDINLQKPKQTIEKINLIKQNIMKQRQHNNFVLKYKGTQLIQMTKFFSLQQNLNKLDTKGLVIRSAAFQNCINDQEVEYALNHQNLNRSAKSIANTVDNDIMNKRNQILNFRKIMDQQQTQYSETELQQTFKRSITDKMMRTFNNRQSISRSNSSRKFRRSLSQIKKIHKLNNLIKKQKK